MQKNSRLIIIFSTLLIFVILIWTFYQYSNNRHQIISMYQEKQQLLAQQASLSLQVYINERIKALEVLADFPASRKGEKEIFKIEYRRTFNKVRGFELIAFLDSTGNKIYSTPEDKFCPARNNAIEFERFLHSIQQARLKRTPVIHQNLTVFEGSAFICLIVPVYDFNEQFRGVIVGVIPLEKSLRHALTPIIKNPLDYVWILNDQGYLIYHLRHKDMLLRNVQRTDSTCTRCHHNFSFEQQMLGTSKGVGLKQNVVNYQQLVGYSEARFHTTVWKVALSSPYSVVIKAINRIIQNLLLSLLLFLLIIIGSAWQIIRLLNRQHAMEQKTQNELARLRLYNQKQQFQENVLLLLNLIPYPTALFTRHKIEAKNEAFSKFLNTYGLPNTDQVEELYKALSQNTREQLSEQWNTLWTRHQRETKFLLDYTSSGRESQYEIFLKRILLFNRLTYLILLIDFTESRQRLRKEHLSHLGEMSARMAHEIKNPLASISAGIQLLEKKFSAEDAQTRDYFKRLREEIHRVNQILLDLLRYARDDVLEKKRCDVSALLEKFLKLAENTAANLGVSVKSEIKLNQKHFMLDGPRLEQVLWNVFNNALDETAKSGEVHFSASSNHQVLRFIIRDFGGGFTKKAREKLFVPFFSTKSSGTGLGLAISKKLVELHGGTIEVNSKEGEGTEVIITIPGAAT